MPLFNWEWEYTKQQKESIFLITSIKLYVDVQEESSLLTQVLNIGKGDQYCIYTFYNSVDDNDVPTKNLRLVYGHSCI